MKYSDYRTQVLDGYLNRDWRWGQAAFNILSQNEVEGIETLRGSLDDPFYRVKTKVTLQTWEDKHLLVDWNNDEILGVV